MVKKDLIAAVDTFLPLVLVLLEVAATAVGLVQC